MSTKLMEMNHGFRGPFAWRDGLEILDGAVIRFVFDGASHTYYVYGVARSQPFVEDGKRVVVVSDVSDTEERDRIRQAVAASKSSDLSDVVWARF